VAVRERVPELREGTDRSSLQCQIQAGLQRIHMISQVAAALGDFLSGNLKFFTAFFMLTIEPLVSFAGEGTCRKGA